MSQLTINVRGLPHPQGSMKAHPLPNGKVAMRYPAAVYAWRSQVQQSVAEEMANNVGLEFPLPGPVDLRLGFELPRPLGHFGTGRNVGTIKASAPTYPIVIPDLDKLIRCICDAVTDAGLWRDDSQVVTLMAGKRYVINGSTPGVLIRVTEFAGDS